jgi:DNA-binding SARP family transcriptional activator
MNFSILGRLEVWSAGRSIGPRESKPRALLAALVVRVNDVVTMDGLLDAVWPENPPRTATHSIHVYISGLRRLLTENDDGPRARPLLVREGRGYRLEIDPIEVDAVRFERAAHRGRALLDAGDAAGASGELRSALALWRGDPVPELADAELARGAASRWEEMRILATESAVEADLALGRHADVVAELRALAGQHPTRERVHELLMLALYRSGRPSDALREFDVIRSTLADELGVDPGPALTRLHAAILRNDPELDGPAGVEGDVGSQATAEVEPELRRIVTVLTASGPSAGPEADPESVRAALASYAAEATPIIERHGGTVEDGISPGRLVAFFGIPRSHEDDALRAVRAAIEIRDSFARKAPDGASAEERTSIPIAVESGQVIAGSSAGRRSIAGEVLAETDRLLDVAARGEIVLGPAAYRLTRSFVAVEPIETGTARQGIRPAAVLLTGVRDERPEASLSSRMVDRTSELRALRYALTRVCESRTAHAFTILGDAGAGKSRLLRELLDGRPANVAVLEGRCVPYGSGGTFAPIVMVIKRAAGIEDGDSRRSAVAKLGRLLEGADQVDLVTGALAQLIGLEQRDLGPGTAVWATRRFVEWLASDRPVILAIEDLHWAEPMLLEALDAIVRSSSGGAILVVSTARREFLDEHSTWGAGLLNAQTLTLDPLSPAQSAELMRNLLGGDALSEDAVRAIVEAADGNPLFVEQMLAMLIDEGTIVRVSARWTETAPIAEIKIPTQIQMLLSARLDLLPRSERLVLERAAVVGRHFGFDAVEALTADAERPAAADALERLTLRGLLDAEAADRYQFRHGLILTAVYETIPKLRRAELHERVADWLDARMGDRADEVDETVGRHLERAAASLRDVHGSSEHADTLAARAGSRFVSAGRRSIDRSDMPGAVALFTAARRLLAPDDPELLSVMPDLGTALVEVGEMERAETVFEEASRAADQLDDVGLKSHVLLYRMELSVWTRGRSAAVDVAAEARRLIPIAEARNDDVSLYRLWRIVGEQAERIAGQIDGNGRAMEHARRAGDRRGQLELLQILSAHLADGPIPVDEALARSVEYLDLARGDRVAEAAVAVNGRTTLLAMAGRIDEARKEGDDARSLFRELGLALWLAASGSIGPARAELIAGDALRGEAMIREGIERLGGIGELGFWAGWEYTLLAETLVELGRIEEASESLEVARALDPHWSLPVIEARLFLATEQWREADAAAVRAIAEIDPDGTQYVAEAHAVRAAALARLGKTRASQEAADSARRTIGLKRSDRLSARVEAIAAIGQDSTTDR